MKIITGLRRRGVKKPQPADGARDEWGDIFEHSTRVRAGAEAISHKSALEKHPERADRNSIFFRGVTQPAAIALKVVH